MSFRRRMKNLKSFGQLEMYETKLKNFQTLRSFLNAKSRSLFSKFTKTKKVSPGNGLKKAYAKFEDDRGIRNNRNRLWKMRKP